MHSIGQRDIQTWKCVIAFAGDALRHGLGDWKERDGGDIEAERVTSQVWQVEPSRAETGG